MNKVQQIVLVVGGILTIYFLAFAPFTYDKTVTNPNYNPKTEGSGGLLYNSAGRYDDKRNFNEERTDYNKRLVFAGSSIIGTGILFFVAKPSKGQ